MNNEAPMSREQDPKTQSKGIIDIWDHFIDYTSKIGETPSLDSTELIILGTVYRNQNNNDEHEDSDQSSHKINDINENVDNGDIHTNKSDVEGAADTEPSNKGDETFRKPSTGEDQLISTYVKCEEESELPHFPENSQNVETIGGRAETIDTHINIKSNIQTGPMENIKSFLTKFTQPTFDFTKGNAFNSSILINEWPEDFLNDLNTRLLFTYRAGFPLIERDKNGPNPLSIGALLRGSFDLSNANKGFTSDSGWGCMIRTSQSLLGNALMNLKLGRQWRLYESCEDDLKKHWDIVSLFADSPRARFSVHNYVLYAAKYCGKKPGEWFGPSNAAKSIFELCNSYPDASNPNIDLDLKVYVSTNSGDIFEDELLKMAIDDYEDGTVLEKIPNNVKFTPILLLCGVRLGLSSINEVYWDFLKLTLSMKFGVGIAGGRPSSSHYFFGYQSNSLFYLDPHVQQNAISLDEFGNIPEENKEAIKESIHTTRIRKLDITKVDPSMLVGFLIKNLDEYKDFKNIIETYDASKRFLNIYSNRKMIGTMDYVESMLDDDLNDLGVESMDEEKIKEDNSLEDNDVDNEYGNVDDIFQKPTSSTILTETNVKLDDELLNQYEKIDTHERIDDVTVIEITPIQEVIAFDTTESEIEVSEIETSNARDNSNFILLSNHENERAIRNTPIA